MKELLSKFNYRTNDTVNENYSKIQIENSFFFTT